MKTYKKYRIVVKNIRKDNTVYYLSKRVTKRSMRINLTQVFGLVFSTKKGALNNLNILLELGYNATLETIVKNKRIYKYA